VELVKFQYSEQVVASTTSACDLVWINIEDDTGECTEPKLWRERN
jgi:hypothetical protein